MDLPALGDILAIPFFALLVKYFMEKPDMTDLERVLLSFSVAGFVADVYFTLWM
jgi:hypothetical protein